MIMLVQSNRDISHSRGSFEVWGDQVFQQQAVNILLVVVAVRLYGLL